MKNITNKILPPALIAVLLILAMSLSALAEQHAGKEDWAVTFTADKKMSSNFHDKVWDDNLTGLQPGDYVDFSVKIKNDNENTTDWYMTNQVIDSLEDTRKDDSGLTGGAYSYVLTYKGNQSDSKDIVLYSSELVGGQDVSKGGQGLHEATNALDDWFYLDTLKKGEGGTVTLRVGLDGETLGNDYQDTLADLEMNFAVELNTPEEDVPKKPDEPVKPDEPEKEKDKKPQNPEEDEKKKNVVEEEEKIIKKSTTTETTNHTVKTGDYTNTVPYLVAAGISGLVLLALAIYSLHERNRQRGGKA